MGRGVATAQCLEAASRGVTRLIGMKCPHCMVEFHDKPVWIPLGPDKDGYWAVLKVDCPACKRMVLRLCNGKATTNHGEFAALREVTEVVLFHPKGSNRPPCPAEVMTAS